MNNFFESLKNSIPFLDGVSVVIVILMSIVALLIVLVSFFALGCEIYLAISYVKYNRTKNSLDMTGCDIARKVLDENGLSDIKVSKSGSLLFGNSYSHYFKKVRLRRLTWKKKSISSMAMAVQKSCLAILDKSGDSDMNTRVKLTPVIYFGPIAFIPMVIIGVLLDIFIFSSSGGVCTTILSLLGLFFYALSFVMSVKVLQTEKKAQAAALQLMAERGIATDSEIAMCHNLFRLYNIEYINNMILALLELIYRVLQILANSRSNSFKN